MGHAVAAAMLHEIGKSLEGLQDCLREDVGGKGVGKEEGREQRAGKVGL